MSDNDPCLLGGNRHCWNNTGLDNVPVRYRSDGRPVAELCSTRRCVWCGRQEHKPYGVAKASWRTTKEPHR